MEDRHAAERQQIAVEDDLHREAVKKQCASSRSQIAGIQTTLDGLLARAYAENQRCLKMKEELRKLAL